MSKSSDYSTLLEHKKNKMRGSAIFSILAAASLLTVISESLGRDLVRDHWPGQDPIGQTIEFGNMDGDLRLLTIVGIVGDVHDYSLDAPSQPTLYVDLFQRPRSAMTITMLSDASTQSVTGAARSILHDLDQ